MKDQLTAEWKRYEKEVKDFEKQMKAKEFHFSLMAQMLKTDVKKWEKEWREDPLMMTERFIKSIDSELKMARACDRPNKPGYEFANND